MLLLLNLVNDGGDWTFHIAKVAQLRCEAVKTASEVRSVEHLQPFKEDLCACLVDGIMRGESHPKMIAFRLQVCVHLWKIWLSSSSFSFSSSPLAPNLVPEHHCRRNVRGA
jgi:hypothetical protein